MFAVALPCVYLQQRGRLSGRHIIPSTISEDEAGRLIAPFCGCGTSRPVGLGSANEVGLTPASARDGRAGRADWHAFPPRFLYTALIKL